MFKKYIHILYIFFAFNVVLLPTFSIFFKWRKFFISCYCGCLSNFKYRGNNDVLTVQKFKNHWAYFVHSPDELKELNVKCSQNSIYKILKESYKENPVNLEIKNI